MDKVALEATNLAPMTINQPISYEIGNLLRVALQILL